MKRLTLKLAAMIAALVLTSITYAQAPSGSTGTCKDGTYTSAASKRGACAGHGGVKDWYATGTPPDTGNMAPPGSSVPATKGTPKSQTAAPDLTKAGNDANAFGKSTVKSTTTSMTPAAGGGHGQVWVNTSTNVYHCEGTKWYGTTKQGAYMSEADAKAKGAHADHGKTCS